MLDVKVHPKQAPEETVDPDPQRRNRVNFIDSW